MDFQQHFPWCFIALLAVSTLTETRKNETFLSSKPNIGNTPSGRIGWKHKGSSPTLSPSGPQQAVVVNCYSDSMVVIVQADLFDTGILVDGRSLQLASNSGHIGGACGAVPSGEAEFTIRVNLTDCGTELSFQNEKIVYSNVLVYSLEPSPDGMLRLGGATFPVECHYHTRYSVDGVALQPRWAAFVSVATADDQMDFRLQLMTDDWQFERGSHVYFVGDPIHLEVSIILGHHMTLRVYVDHCVATPTPDPVSSLRYDFIEHYGCLADSHLSSSNSHFLLRVQENKLQFQLDAFRFYQESTNLIYVTCNVKAVPAMLAVSARNRACSFIDNRWRSVDGNDQACRSCDVSQQFEGPDLTEPLLNAIPTERTAMALQGYAHWDGSKPNQASYLRPGIRQSKRSNPQQSSLAGVTMVSDSRADWTKTTHLGPLIILPSKIITKEAVSTPSTTPAAPQLNTTETVLRGKQSGQCSKPADAPEALETTLEP